MGSRHRMPAPPVRHRPVAGRRTNVVIGTISAAVAGAGLVAGALVHLSAPGTTAGSSTAVAPPEAGVAAPAPAPADTGPQFLSQRGTIVAVSPDSVTARSADGVTRTYRLTPDTTAITGPGETSSDPAAFTVNDEVEIVAAVHGDTAVATAVADQSMTGLNGPPMHFVDHHTVSKHTDGPVMLP